MEGAGAATSCCAAAGLAAGVLPVAAGSEGRAGTCTPQPYLEDRAPKTASGSRCPSFFVALRLGGLTSVLSEIWSQVVEEPTAGSRTHTGVAPRGAGMGVGMSLSRSGLLEHFGQEATTGCRGRGRLGNARHWKGFSMRDWMLHWATLSCAF